MPAAKYHLVHWLREAYAMEQQSIDALERQLAQPQDDAALEKRLRFHLEETRNQVEKIQICLEHLGSNTGSIKVGLGRLVGNMHAITTALGPHEVVKTLMVDVMFEHFEICTYEALIIAAKKAGEDDIANICSAILHQEKVMATWMEDYLPDITLTFLQTSGDGVVHRLQA